METAFGLAELFTFWTLLYLMAGSSFGAWVYRLQVWADEQIRKFEDQS